MTPLSPPMSAPAPSRIAIESGDSSRGPKRPAISAPSRAAISADSVATISKLGFSPDEFLLNIAPVKPALAIYLFCAALLAATTAVAQENCGPAVIEPVAGATGARVQEYRGVFESCVKGDETRLATRRLRIEGEELLLTVDPETLETTLTRAACWRCEPTSDEEQAQTRFLQAVRPPPDASRPPALVNA